MFFYIRLSDVSFVCFVSLLSSEKQLPQCVIVFIRRIAHIAKFFQMWIFAKILLKNCCLFVSHFFELLAIYPHQLETTVSLSRVTSAELANNSHFANSAVF